MRHVMARMIRGVAPAIALLALGVPASAHVCNIDLSRPAAVTVCGDPDEGQTTYTPTESPDGTVSITDGQFKRFGWVAGTNRTLGNSHELDGGNFFTFHVDRFSLVTIRVVPEEISDPLDVAFSLYWGKLPTDGHDDTAYDPLNPVDDTTFLPIASPTDKAPFARWTYHPHDGYRDTLRYSTTGGLGPDGYPLHPFIGQFDALGSWSMANADAIPGDPESAAGNWAKIYYILSLNTRGAGEAETMRALPLPPGDYTLAVGGANCNTDAPACVDPLETATVSVQIRPLLPKPRHLAIDTAPLGPRLPVEAR